MILKIKDRVLFILKYSFYIAIILIVFDVFVLNKLLGFGHLRDFEQENIVRFPAPYVGFTGKPNAYIHNEFGFRGSSFKEAKTNDFKIAFFGGSTGYRGNPPIAKIVEKRLEKLWGVSIFVANYSVISSNHRQHLHGIIEFLPQFKPDLVIFYGGYNETIQHTHPRYDPRPGYPYNHFYRAETSPFFKLLLQNSAIIGEIDKRIGVFTGINKLRVAQQPLSDDWNRRIAEKYYETLALANNIAGTLESKYFGNTQFLAFYQPYQVPKKFLSTHSNIKKHIGTLKYAFDVSSEYDVLGKKIYKDSVHVRPPAREVMGAKIANIIASCLMPKSQGASVSKLKKTNLWETWHC